MSEAGDFDPGPWAGHDFKSAYRAYDTHAGRSYADAVTSAKSAEKLFEPSITTNCRRPLIVFSDVTGSMGEWPKVMFSKLPYLELEAREYLGSDLEIAFGAIGDAYSDQYPLQIRPFTSGTDLKERMLELVIEGNGGNQLHETYELAALYCLRNLVTPNALRPIVIIIGDEMPYPTISPDMAESVAGVKIAKQVTTKQVFDQLKALCSVYLIRKPYRQISGDELSAQDREIRGCWVELLGADHICELPSAERVVDVIFGILAQETGRIDYFRDEIEGRQRPDQVDTVYKSLKTVHRAGGGRTLIDDANPSVLKLEDKGKPSKDLL